jgi:hypothetical protein
MPTPTDLRSSVDDLHRLAAGDLRSLWRQVQTADQAREALNDVLPLLIRSYGAAAATIAADWYDDVRDELRVPGRFRAIPAEVGNRGADVLARWSVGPLYDADPDWRRALVLVNGGLQRRITDVARDTTTFSSVQDPQAQGWQRAGVGECAFCTMLISRGAVYTSATVDFSSHDHCKCHAAPAFKGRPRPVKPYTPSAQNVTDADRARVRAYLAEHSVG